MQKSLHISYARLAIIFNINNNFLAKCAVVSHPTNHIGGALCGRGCPGEGAIIGLEVAETLAVVPVSLARNHIHIVVAHIVEHHLRTRSNTEGVGGHGHLPVYSSLRE